MKILATFALILTIFVSNGQVSNDLVLTKEGNEDWLETILKLPSGEKFEFLKARLLADTNVYLPETHPDKSFEKSIDEGKVQGTSKPKVYINGMLINTYDFSKSNEVVILCSLLNERNFKKMKIVDAQLVSTLHGKGYYSGLFYLRTRDKDIENQIKVLKLDWSRIDRE